jgi:hypothetical protein
MPLGMARPYPYGERCVGTRLGPARADVVDRSSGVVMRMPNRRRVVDKDRDFAAMSVRRHPPAGRSGPGGTARRSEGWETPGASRACLKPKPPATPRSGATREALHGDLLAPPCPRNGRPARSRPPRAHASGPVARRQHLAAVRAAVREDGLDDPPVETLEHGRRRLVRGDTRVLGRVAGARPVRLAVVGSILLLFPSAVLIAAAVPPIVAWRRNEAEKQKLGALPRRRLRTPRPWSAASTSARTAAAAHRRRRRPRAPGRPGAARRRAARRCPTRPPGRRRRA